MQRTEVLEVEEPFTKGQKGSSAMPHKRNPILSENLSGLARYVRSNLAPAFENIPLWHERDISHSSVERVIGPDSSVTIHFMLRRVNGMLKGLNVYKKNMLKNIYITNGIIFSQNVLIKLIEKGITREESYKLVQKNAHYAWDKSKDFKTVLSEDKNIMSLLSIDEIESCFKFNNLFDNARKILKKVIDSK